MRRLPDLCAVVPPATSPAQLNTGWDLTISRLLQHIVSLLSTPKVERPLIWAMAQQYVNNRGAFDDEARRRTSAFAMGDDWQCCPEISLACSASQPTTWIRLQTYPGSFTRP